MTKFREDVASGAYPKAKHCILKSLKDEEFRGFMNLISAHKEIELPTAPFKPKNKKLTIADLKALKGKRKIVLVTAFDEWTARAAEEAGVDMLVAWGADWESTKYVVEQVRKASLTLPRLTACRLWRVCGCFLARLRWSSHAAPTSSWPTCCRPRAFFFFLVVCREPRTR